MGQLTQAKRCFWVWVDNKAVPQPIAGEWSIKMIETVLAFFATGAGKGVLISLGIYILSLFGNSVWYGKAREAIGRAAEAAGVGLSALGGSKLGFLWNPTEKVLCDFLFFAVEQFAVGLRKDNPEKMGRQLERLESVDSQARAAALAAKLATIPPPPRDKSDAEVMAQAVATMDAGNQERLKG